MISNHDATLLCHPQKRNKTLDWIRVILPRPVRDSFKTKKTKTKLHQGLGTWVNCLNPTIVSYSVIRLVRKCYRRLELIVLWFQTHKRPRRSQWLYERTHVELLPRGFCCCYHWLYSFSSVSGCSYGWFCVSVTNQHSRWERAGGQTPTHLCPVRKHRKEKKKGCDHNKREHCLRPGERDSTRWVWCIIRSPRFFFFNIMHFLSHQIISSDWIWSVSKSTLNPFKIAVNLPASHWCNTWLMGLLPESLLLLFSVFSFRFFSVLFMKWYSCSFAPKLPNVTYSAFPNMNRGIRTPKCLMHHIYSTICNLLLFLCLQGTKSDEPCDGRDCSKGCKCIPEKGGRVSHVPSARCRLGSRTVKIPSIFHVSEQLKEARHVVFLHIESSSSHFITFHVSI